MNILNWILFVLLNVCLTNGISGFRLITNVSIWLFIIEESYSCIFLWLLLVFPFQFLILPILYEFLNKKSQIFLFLNKQKNLTFCFKFLFLTFVADFLSLFIISKLWKTYFTLFCFFGNLFVCYLSFAIWLKLRKCIFFKLRKEIKSIGKWLSKRKFVTLKNIVIVLHLIFAAELVPLCLSTNREVQLFFPSFVVILSTLAFIELISVLSFTKKQKAQPFQRGIIFINSFLIFIYTQIAISILFFVDLI